MTATRPLRRADGSVVAACRLAVRPLARMRGLLGKRGLAPGEALWIEPASSIHMFFMRFPIDAVFLDRQGVVRKIVPDLRPWGMAGCRGARVTVELGAGEAARHGLTVGERLELGEALAPPERAAA
jgi:uncharacterized membrane protein (UPF0127 family)